MSEFTHSDLKAVQVPPLNSEKEVVCPVHPRHGLEERGTKEGYQTLRGKDERREGRGFAYKLSQYCSYMIIYFSGTLKLKCCLS